MKATITSWFAASTLMECDMENTPIPQMGGAQESASPVAAALPGSAAYGELPQFPKSGVLPFRRTIRRQELRQIVPLAETTIYEMERRGRIPASLQSDASLRRVGPGRSGSLDRRTQTSPTRRQRETGCPPTKNPPRSGGFERRMMRAMPLIRPEPGVPWTPTAATAGPPSPR